MSLVRICIDPGKRAAAVSMSIGQEIVRAGMVRARVPEEMTDVLQLGDALFRALVMNYGTADQLHIERPVHEPHRKGQVNPQDLFDLSVVVGCFNTVGREIFSYTPMTWKGSVPKPIHHGRIAPHMLNGTAKERALWETFSKRVGDHNVRDAIALNLFALKRVRRGGE